MNLYRKYRPSIFGEILGQDLNVKIIENFILSNKIPQSIILSGKQGIGKTSIARILAKSINCKNRASDNFEPCNNCDNCKEISKSRSIDVIEMDGASNNGVDEIRRIKQMSSYLPNQSKMKIYIIDEFHMLSNSAFNALLKILEEPPEFIMFILATTEIHQIPSTIISRCVLFDLKPIPLDLIEKQLKEVSLIENITVDENSLKKISDYSNGSMRDALSVLEKTIIFDSNVSIKNVNRILGLVDESKINRLISALEFGDKKSFANLIDKLRNFKFDFKVFIRDFENLLLDYIIRDSESNLSKVNVMEIVEQLEKISELDISQNIALKIFLSKIFDLINQNKKEKNLRKIEKIASDNLDDNLSNALANKIDKKESVTDIVETINEKEKPIEETIEQDILDDAIVPKKESDKINNELITKSNDRESDILETVEDNFDDFPTGEIPELTGEIDVTGETQKEELTNKVELKSKKNIEKTSEVNNNENVHFDHSKEPNEISTASKTDENKVVKKEIKNEKENGSDDITNTNEFNTSELDILKPDDLDSLNDEEIKSSSVKKLECNFKYSIEEISAIVVNRDMQETNFVKDNWSSLEIKAYPNEHFKKYSTISTISRPLIVSDNRIIIIKVKDRDHYEDLLNSVCSKVLFDLTKETFNKGYYIYPVMPRDVLIANNLLEDKTNEEKFKRMTIDLPELEDDYIHKVIISKQEKTEEYLKEVFGEDK